MTMTMLDAGEVARKAFDQAKAVAWEAYDEAVRADPKDYKLSADILGDLEQVRVQFAPGLADALPEQARKDLVTATEVRLNVRFGARSLTVLPCPKCGTLKAFNRSHVPGPCAYCGEWLEKQGDHLVIVPAP